MHDQCWTNHFSPFIRSPFARPSLVLRSSFARPSLVLRSPFARPSLNL